MSFSVSSLFSSLKQSATVPPSRDSVGIDIGSGAIKVIELEDTDKGPLLRTYGELQLGPYADEPLGSSVVLNAKRKTDAVVDVLREAKVKVRHGALAMPLSSSFMTVITVGSDAGDLSAIVPVEARKYIPIPLPEVSLDWTELPKVGEAETSVREILLAAIENRALSEFSMLMQTIGMTSEPSEIEAFSLLRSLGKPDDTTLAIMDFGAKSAKLYIARNGSLERVHRVFAGGAQISKRITELLSMSFEDAENLKRGITGTDQQAHDVFRATASVLEGPLAEFRRIMDQYEARLGAPINRVVLSGGVSAFSALPQYASDMLAREVTMGDPFVKVGYPAFMEDTLRSVAPVFGVSVGAALRRFNAPIT